MKGSAALKKDVGAGDRRSGFEPGTWLSSINVRDFIVERTPDAGDQIFRTGVAAHQGRLGKAETHFAEDERRVFSVDVANPSTSPGTSRDISTLTINYRRPATDQPFSGARFSIRWPVDGGNRRRPPVRADVKIDVGLYQIPEVVQ